MRKRMELCTALSIIIILFFSCSRPRSFGNVQDSSWARVQLKSSLVIGISDYVPILSFRNEKQQLVGYDIDILTGVCHRLGIRPIFTPIDWSQKEKLLNTGVIDCIASGFSITDERKQRYCMCMPYLQNAKVLVTPTNKGYETLAQLQGKTVGVEAGTNGADALLNIPKLKKRIIIQEMNNIDELYKALDAGICNAIVQDLIYAFDMLEQNPNYTIMNEAIATEYYTFAFRKNDQALMSKVESMLIEMEDDGAISHFSEKWFGANLSILNVGL